MSVPFALGLDSYNLYVIQSFGPRMRWRRKRFSLWPRRSTVSNKWVWMQPVVIGYYEYRSNFGDRHICQQLATVTEEEFTYLTLVNFYQEEE